MWNKIGAPHKLPPRYMATLPCVSYERGTPVQIVSYERGTPAQIKDGSMWNNVAEKHKPPPRYMADGSPCEPCRAFLMSEVPLYI